MLVKAGYIVGRVEQTQTPKELAEANKQKQGKKEKVVERTLVDITTTGTLTDPELIGTAQAQYLLAVRERVLDDREIAEKKANGFTLPLGGEVYCEYGVCFLDASTAQIHVGQFYDDEARSQLSTLLGSLDPAELCYPLGNLSQRTLEVVKNECRAKMTWSLKDGVEFYNAEHTYEVLGSETHKGGRGYFKEKKHTDNSQHPSDDDEQPETEDVWPSALLQLAEQRADLAFSALGGIVYVLQHIQKDAHILQQKHFSLYSPSHSGIHAEHLVLDSQTLINLEVIKDSEGNDTGSLLHYVDQCVSGMGHRMMKRWITQPLASTTAINDRLNAVQWLMQNETVHTQCSTLLKTFHHADLERLVSIIHSHSMKKEKNEVMYGQQDQKVTHIYICSMSTNATCASCLVFY